MPSLLELYDREFEPSRVIIGPDVLLEGGTMILGGPAESGKSFVALALMRALVLGERPFSYSGFEVPKSRRVLYLEQELTEYGLQKRVRAMFTREELDKAEAWYVSHDHRMRLDTFHGLSYLQGIVREIEPEVIILDPISQFHAIPEDDASSIQSLFFSLDSLRSKGAPGCALILIHHFRKPWEGPGQEPQDKLSPYQFRGSSKFYDVPDTRVTLRRKIELGRDRWILETQWRMRHAPTVRFDLELRVSGGSARVEWRAGSGSGSGLGQGSSSGIARS